MDKTIDYYPYGWRMPGRVSIGGERYRFGYQGQFAEYDPETGYNHFEARLLDTRIGRWLTTDPAGQFFSPYVSMGNNPVNGVDPDGELFFGLFGSTSQERKMMRAFAQATGGNVKNLLKKSISIEYEFDNFEYTLDESFIVGGVVRSGPVLTRFYVKSFVKGTTINDNFMITADAFYDKRPDYSGKSEIEFGGEIQLIERLNKINIRSQFTKIPNRGNYLFNKGGLDFKYEGSASIIVPKTLNTEMVKTLMYSKSFPSPFYAFVKGSKLGIPNPILKFNFGANIKLSTGHIGRGKTYEYKVPIMKIP